ncbi:MAG: DUF4442 domain-containing protein [Candidatus Marinimicrobia bacterium]|nr:DUF4442 domain-containing protein [Candidatus Neomarinimicrobiota bacterium]|tara:strand:- start:1951 stop:2430 length:480 start_codon:yes stop_codon:yes gene_type:complete
MNFISKEFKTTLFLKFFGFLKVPMIFYCNPRVLKISEESVEIKISLKRKTKNHVGSMYFGALSVGADVTGGAIALGLIKKSKYKINLLFKDFKADFLKRAEGDVHFVCNDGLLISDMIKETEISKKRVNKPINIIAYVPKKLNNEPVAKFVLTLSLKAS